MHCLATLRTVIIAAALGLAFPLHADADLDAMIDKHVMPRFDRQARVFINKSGARFVSSHWNSETHTLIAIGEMERRLPAAPLDVAHEVKAGARLADLKTDHVAELCRHPNFALIRRFLEKYEVTIELVYIPGRTHLRPMVVEISHSDLSGCV